MKNGPFDVQCVSRGCFAIEIDGEWRQYSETAEIVKGVTGDFKPPQWVIDHKENQRSKNIEKETSTTGAPSKATIKVDKNSMVCGISIVRQPIKPLTDDEFNNAQQVAYGSYIQVEPLKDE